MKAVVYRGPRNIRVEDVSEPKPKRDEALVRFKVGSICGTDLHFYRGEWTDLAVGRIIGHDACGQVEETGERVAIIPAVRVDTARMVDPTCVSAAKVSWASNLTVSFPS